MIRIYDVCSGCSTEYSEERLARHKVMFASVREIPREWRNIPNQKSNLVTDEVSIVPEIGLNSTRLLSSNLEASNAEVHKSTIVESTPLPGDRSKRSVENGQAIEKADRNNSPHLTSVEASVINVFDVIEERIDQTIRRQQGSKSIQTRILQLCKNFVHTTRNVVIAFLFISGITLFGAQANGLLF